MRLNAYLYTPPNPSPPARERTSIQNHVSSAPSIRATHAKMPTATKPQTKMLFTPAEAAMLTPFQKRVYHLLAQIPAGRVTTYGSLARALNTSPRAVGNALRNNVFAPRIPCHRCVASTGYVNGYDGEVIQRTTYGNGGIGSATQSKPKGAKARMAANTTTATATATAAAGVNKKGKTEPPSGTNIQMKLALLKDEGVSFDSKGMLKNKHRVLFEGPWDVAA